MGLLIIIDNKYTDQIKYCSSIITMSTMRRKNTTKKTQKKRSKHSIFRFDLAVVPYSSSTARPFSCNCSRKAIMSFVSTSCILLVICRWSHHIPHTCRQSLFLNPYTSAASSTLVMRFQEEYTRTVKSGCYAWKASAALQSSRFHLKYLVSLSLFGSG